MKERMRGSDGGRETKKRVTDMSSVLNTPFDNKKMRKLKGEDTV